MPVRSSVVWEFVDVVVDVVIYFFGWCGDSVDIGHYLDSEGRIWLQGDVDRQMRRLDETTIIEDSREQTDNRTKTKEMTVEETCGERACPARGSDDVTSVEPTPTLSVQYVANLSDSACEESRPVWLIVS